MTFHFYLMYLFFLVSHIYYLFIYYLCVSVQSIIITWFLVSQGLIDKKFNGHQGKSNSNIKGHMFSWMCVSVCIGRFCRKQKLFCFLTRQYGMCFGFILDLFSNIIIIYTLQNQRWRPQQQQVMFKSYPFITVKDA